MELIIDDALVRFAGDAVPMDLPVDVRAGDGGVQPAPAVAWEAPVRGTVYGTLLNFHGALAALGDAAMRPPYKAPPKAPVLYIKPRNTLSAHRRNIVVPAGVEALEMGASLGLVIGRAAARLREQDALAHVAGYTVVNDVCVPHDNYYRPSIRFRCRDGFCPIGPWAIARRSVVSPDALEIRVSIDGVVVQVANTRDLVRSAARLLADVTDFMTLAPGDVLMVGVPAGAPRGRAGQHVAITIDGVGTLENTLVAQTPGAAQ